MLKALCQGPPLPPCCPVSSAKPTSQKPGRMTHHIADAPNAPALPGTHRCAALVLRSGTVPGSKARESPARRHRALRTASGALGVVVLSVGIALAMQQIIMQWLDGALIALSSAALVLTVSVHLLGRYRRAGTPHLLERTNMPAHVSRAVPTDSAVLASSARR